MSKYDIVFSKSAAKELSKYDSRINNRISRAIARLAQDPRPSGSKKLKDGTENWRIRIGNYRVVYSIDDEILIVDIRRIAHRKEFLQVINFTFSHFIDDYYRLKAEIFFFSSRYISMRPLALLLFSFLILNCTLAQESSVNNLFKVDYETPLTIDLKERQENTDGPEEAIIDPFRKKKKKKNPKVFFGIKTKRGFTKTGFRDRVVTELFHYLKEKDYVGPDEYDRDFYWYDFKRKKIVNSLKADPRKSGVLHGHYIKKMGEQVLEEGYFYKGKKHGRWVELNTSDILTDKKIFWKGWPEESRMRFYDFQREQLMEVIPVHFGEREGTYYAFHENGQVAAVGQYKFDQKIGVWREFYDNRRIKREIQYPEDPFDDAPSYILREFSKDGKELYNRERFFSGVD